MNVKIGSRWNDVIAEAIESGRFASEEDVVSAAMALLAERERRLKELKALIDEAYEDDTTEALEDVLAATERVLEESSSPAAK